MKIKKLFVLYYLNCNNCNVVLSFFTIFKPTVTYYLDNILEITFNVSLTLYKKNRKMENSV